MRIVPTLESRINNSSDLYRDDPLFVQDVAWGVFERYASGDLDNKAIMSLAADAVEKSLAKSTVQKRQICATRWHDSSTH